MPQHASVCLRLWRRARGLPGTLLDRITHDAQVSDLDSRPWDQRGWSQACRVDRRPGLIRDEADDRSLRG
jgi:hypothetical protein